MKYKVYVLINNIQHTYEFNAKTVDGAFRQSKKHDPLAKVMWIQNSQGCGKTYDEHIK